MDNETPGSCFPLAFGTGKENLLRIQVQSILGYGVRFKFTVLAVQPWASQPQLAEPQFTYSKVGYWTVTNQRVVLRNRYNKACEGKVMPEES